MPAVERRGSLGATDARRIARRVGEELRQARLIAGVSQATAGRAANMSHTQIGRIERGELQGLTGLSVEENQARRLLNDLASFTHHFGMQDEEPTVTASRWMTKVYEPIMAMVPAELRGKLEPAEIFHEILVHRWYLSERAGREVSIFETARDYIDHVLKHKPDELVTPAAGPAPEDTTEMAVVAEDVAPPPIGSPRPGVP